MFGTIQPRAALAGIAPRHAMLRRQRRLQIAGGGGRQACHTDPAHTDKTRMQDGGRMSKARKGAGRDIPTAHALIEAVPLFGALSPTEREALAGEARLQEVAAGTTIFARGDTEQDVYLVASGRVRLSVFSAEGKVLTFVTAGAGDIFGEMAAFDGGARSADATAMLDTVVYSLPGALLLKAFTRTPKAAEAAIVLLSAKVRATSAQVEDIALHSLIIRVARFFLSALKLTKTPLAAGDTVQLDLQMSQTEIGWFVGATRQNINKALSHLKKEGALRELQRNLYSCNVPALKRIALAD
ncbi:MAG: Crp/Fnr family transcriptional regulator [Hyphomicrobiaceae bacterium]|nr:Crp/Fnr family transcriptional regulator [Hyphomicrobiaceae bacterium]